MMKKQYSTYYRWLPSLLWMGFIFFLSHQEAGSSSALSSGITQTVLNILSSALPFLNPETDFFHFLVRKGAHFTAYLILALLLVYAMKPRDLKSYARVFLLCALYAMSDEFHQTFVPGRSGEIRDVLLDSAGALTGILLSAYARMLVLKRGMVKAARKSAS